VAEVGAAVITRFFKQKARVDQRENTQNAMGGATYTYSPRIAELKCRLAKRNIKEVDQFGKDTIREIYRAYCSATLATKTITASDRFVLGSDVFEVTGIYNPGGLDRHLEIDLQRID